MKTPKQRILELLDGLVAISGETINHLSGKDINGISFFSFGMVRRIYDAAFSLRHLLADIENNQALDLSVAVTIRAITLDFLIGMNLFRQIKEQKDQGVSAEEIVEFTKRYANEHLADGLRQTVSYVQQAENLGYKTPEETAATFNKLAQDYPVFFQAHPGDGSKPIVSTAKTKTASELFSDLARSEVTGQVATLYDTYAYLSKYDHFGIMYYHVSSEDLNQKLSIYLNVIGATVAHHAFFHSLLSEHSEGEEFLAHQKKKAEELLLASMKSIDEATQNREDV